ncbi:MAG: DUF4198 domain-containing protein [Candidatus Saccharibacteria bacterium]|nr:DUF4198 domain-containing protein [Moraxellaceae bacterium]
MACSLKLSSTSATLLFLTSSIAMAHTPYILPYHFDTNKDIATIQASATEDFFIPDHGISGDFFVTSPAGVTTPITDVTSLKEVTLAQVPLAENGTYRITLKAKPRMSKFAHVDGRWLSVRPAHGAGGKPKGAQSERGYVTPEELASDAKMIESTSTRTLETFVTKARGSDKVLKISGKGLEVKLNQNPSSIFLDQGLEFDVLFDGKPIKNQIVEIEQAGKAPLELKSDDKGHVKATFTQAGTYLLEVNYPNDPESHSEKGRTTPPQATSYNYGLTFGVSQ